MEFSSLRLVALMIVLGSTAPAQAEGVLSLLDQMYRTGFVNTVTRQVTETAPQHPQTVVTDRALLQRLNTLTHRTFPRQNSPLDRIRAARVMVSNRLRSESYIASDGRLLYRHSGHARYVNEHGDLVSTSAENEDHYLTRGLDIVSKSNDLDGYNEVFRTHHGHYVVEQGFLYLVGSDRKLLTTGGHSLIQDQGGLYSWRGRRVYQVLDVSGISFDYLAAFNTPFHSNRDEAEEDIRSRWELRGQQLYARRARPVPAQTPE